MSEISHPTDAYKATITDIKLHPNADALELAYIGRRECVVKKDTFYVGQPVLYIQSDALLNTQLDWVVPFIGYLGSSGRVRACKLRGIISAGIIVALHQLPIDISALTNEEICKQLQIDHYVNPEPTNNLECLRPSLPPGIEKSDEVNYYALSDEDLHLGEEVLITRKMDGSSALLYYNPENEVLEICSRRQSLKLSCDSDYVKALSPYIPQARFLADYFQSPVAIRGEVCGNKINDSKVNRDAKQPLGFYMYGMRVLYGTDMASKYGRWESGTHFTDINKILEAADMDPIPTVPVLGVETVTPDMFEYWKNRPASEGEGVVVNGKTFSYKIKSDEYDAKLG